MARTSVCGDGRAVNVSDDRSVVVDPKLGRSHGWFGYVQRVFLRTPHQQACHTSDPKHTLVAGWHVATDRLRADSWQPTCPNRQHGFGRLLSIQRDRLKLRSSMNARVVAVSQSPSHTMSKPNGDEIRLIAGLWSRGRRSFRTDSTAPVARRPRSWPAKSAPGPLDSR